MSEEKEQANPIPEGSVVTEEMISAYAAAFEIDLEDGEQRPGVLGSLLELEKGEGEVHEKVSSDEVFAPLVTAYEAAKAAKGEGSEEGAEKAA